MTGQDLITANENIHGTKELDNKILVSVWVGDASSPLFPAATLE